MPILRLPFLIPALIALALSIVDTDASAQIVPVLDREAAAIGRCMDYLNATPRKAVEMAEKRLAEGGLAPFHEIRWLTCLGVAKGYMGHPEEIVALEQRAQKIVDVHWPEFNELQQVFVLNDLADIFRSEGDLPRAMAAYSRIETIDDSAASTENKIRIAKIKGYIYSETLHSYDAADLYYRREFELSEGKSTFQPIVDFNYANNLVMAERYDEAGPLFDRLVEQLKDSPTYTLLRYRADVMRAAVLGAKGQHDKALVLLEEAREKLHENKDLIGEACAVLQIAQEQWGNGRHDEALASAQQAVVMLQQVQLTQEEEEAQRLLAKIYESDGNFPRAFEAIKRADAITLATLKVQNLHNRVVAENALKPSPKRSEADAGVPGVTLVGSLAAAMLLAFTMAGLWLGNRRRFFLPRGTDELTGLPNRHRAIARLMAKPVSRQALLLIGIDRLHAINDLYGYEVGDSVIRQLASRLREFCGGNDFAARWNEDEFLIILADATCERATARAKEVCRMVEESQTDLSDGDALKISISLGIASFPFFPQGAGEDWHDSLRLANRALQSARRVGMNAWASIWGLAAKDSRSTATIAQAPLHAAQSGLIRLEASSPLAWQT